MEERIQDFPDQTLGISHTGDPDIVEELVTMIHERFGQKHIMINKIGSSLSSHLGVGGIGVFFFNKKIEMYME